MPVEPLSAADIVRGQESVGISFRDGALFALALTHRSFVNENPAAGAESNERLEFLGDGVINLVVGYRLFAEAPGAAEGALTARRAQVVRRETLAAAAQRMGLGSWLVMGRGEALSGGAERASNLANAFEALVGAVFLDQGFEATYEFTLRALADDIAAASLAGPPKDPKSVLQELLQANGRKSPEYSTIATGGPEHQRTFVVEVLVDGQVSGRGEGRRKIDAERAAATDAVRALGGQNADGDSGER